MIINKLWKNYSEEIACGLACGLAWGLVGETGKWLTNIRYFRNKFNKKLELCRQGLIDKEHLESFLCGWFGYSKFANTYNFNKNIEKIIESVTTKLNKSK